MIKFLVDECVTPKVVEILNDFGYEAVCVKDILPGVIDEDLFTYAAKNDLIILTHDTDFGSIFYFSSTEKVGVIIIRVFPQTPVKTILTLKKFLDDIDLEKESMNDALIIVGENKVRIRRKNDL